MHRRLVYIYLLNVPSFSSRYFNKIKRTSCLGRLLALSLEILSKAKKNMELFLRPFFKKNRCGRVGFNFIQAKNIYGNSFFQNSERYFLKAVLVPLFHRTLKPEMVARINKQRDITRNGPQRPSGSTWLLPLKIV